ncbi:MAG TPA: biotin/lipoyl-binding protein, partial [Candidatus Melainabacteria bacterium]|nr:biotin/lipoyl-binding protein [Candidatus Melainabacteria bacterium]
MNWLQQLLNPKEAARETSLESSNIGASTRPEGTKKKRGQKRLWIIGAVALSLAAGGAYFLTQGPKTNKDWKKDATQVKRGVATLKVVATGLIKPVREVKISPKQTGLLKELYVTQGDRVKKGQIIALMDDSNLAGQIEAARGAWLSTVDNSMKMKNGNRPQEVLQARFQQQRAREGVRNAEHNISRLS